jgi:ketosteroid isomerase-like protein
VTSHGNRRPPPSSAITAVGVDHVQLSYHYLDTGDIDGYGSLLHENAHVERPDAERRRGRAEVLRLHTEIAGPPGRHRIHKIIANGDSIAAVGHFSGPPPTPHSDAELDVDFVDVFELSDDGLLMGYRRFYFVPPENAAT